MTARAGLAATLLAAAAVLPSAPARAEGGAEKPAQTLFVEAMKLMAKKQYAEACDKLARSLELDPGMGAQFRLAECYEKLGRLASAFDQYTSVADAAKAAGKPDREVVARKRAIALEPKVARLTIQIPPAVAALPGVEVMRDGARVDEKLWGTAVPVDPGDHLVHVQAPGKKPFEGKVWAEPAAKLVVAVAALENVPPPFDENARQPKNYAPAIALGAAGGVGLILGATFIGLRASKVSSAQKIHDRILGAGSNCVTGGVKPPADDCGALASDAKAADRFGTASVVAFTVGGAALAGMGAYLLVPPPKVPRPKDAALLVAPWISSNDAGLAAWGTF